MIPTREYARRKKLKHQVNRFVTDDEVFRFIQSFKPSEKKFLLYFVVEATTGLRSVECRHLNIADFIPNTGMSKFMVRLAKTGIEKPFDLPSWVAEMMRNHVALNLSKIVENGGWIFWSDTMPGKPMGYSAFNNILAKKRKQIGVTDYADVRHYQVAHYEIHGKKGYEYKTVDAGKSDHVHRFGQHSLRRWFITRASKVMQPDQIRQLTGQMTTSVVLQYIDDHSLWNKQSTIINDMFPEKLFDKVLPCSESNKS